MANSNYRIESQKFFNAQTSQNHRSWAKSAAAYYRSVGGTTKTNFVDAMAAYFAKINAGTISAPIIPTSTQYLLNNGTTVSIRNNAAADAHSATAVVSGGALTGFNLAQSIAMVDNADTFSCKSGTDGLTATGTAVVSTAGNVTQITLSSSSAIVTTAPITCTVSGSGTSGFTATIVNGAITAITLQ